MSKKMLIFEELSAEIYYEIFDYLSSNDIISTFFDLNQRFNRIIMNYSRYLHHFITPIKNLSFWKRILPEINSQIQCLTITQINSYFSLNLFPNIQCLILSCPLPIYNDQFDLIIETDQFKKLKSFKMKTQILNKGNIYCNDITTFSRIFNSENSLITFESLVEFNRYFQLKMILNLQSLSMKLMDIRLFLYLLKFTPNLKYLNIIISRISFINQIFTNDDFSHIKLEKFSLLFENGALDETIFLSLSSFIKQFSSSLISLSLNSSQIPLCNYEINGFILYEHLLKSMINLKSFHFYIKLDKIPENLPKLFSTFQTQFWFDHLWNIGINKKYIFTLPFHFPTFIDFLDFNQIQLNHFNSFDTWSYIKSIEFSKSFLLNSNLIEEMNLKMRNLSTFTMNHQLFNDVYTNNNQINLPLNHITTLHLSNVDLLTIKQCLMNVFPNTKRLFLRYDHKLRISSTNKMNFTDNFAKRIKTDQLNSSTIEYVEIEGMFPPNVVDLEKNIMDFVKELLKIFNNPQLFIFQFTILQEFLRSEPLTNLNELIQMLNEENISEKYQIEQIQNYLQFNLKE